MSRTPTPTTPPDMAAEQEAHAEGFARVCGIDEAGRGPLAGPVVAAAVILPAGYELPGLNDSKKLTAKKREALYEALMADDAVQKSIAQATVEEIDELNILRATHLAKSSGRGVARRGGFLPDRRAAGAGLPAAEPQHCEGGCALPEHRRRQHSGQGVARPLHAGAAPPVPGVRLRPPRRLRH